MVGRLAADALVAMSISSNYGAMQHQVADELGDRTDLLQPLGDSGLTLSPIQNAIQSAIAKWEREPFYFNEYYAINLFNTAADQEFYSVADEAAIALMPKITRIHILVNNNRFTIYQRTWQYLEDISVNPSVVTSIPVDYAYFAEQVRLYPIPDGSYPLTMNGNNRLTALVNAADANAWTEDAYDLIRSEAKLILAQEVLHDPDMQAEMKTAIYGDPRSMFGYQQSRGYLYALKAESTRRSAQGRLRPSYF